MLLVKTKIGESCIHGLGLLADQDIKQGTVIWKFAPNLDLVLTKEWLKDYDEEVANRLLDYCYRVDDKYILCCDNARFINHSSKANTIDNSKLEAEVIAKKDIKAGEEITSNYADFDDDFYRKLLRNFL